MENKQPNEDDLEGKSPEVASEPASEITPGDNPGISSVKNFRKGKKIFERFNIYLVAFVFLLVVGGAVAVVVFLNGKKVPPEPTVVTQELTQETLNQLSKGDASVGDPSTVLNVQSNAVFANQVLIGGDLNVAGTLRLGKPLSVPDITVSNNANFNNTQINTLQVAQDTTLQGSLVLQKDLNVAGSADFNGAVRTNTLTTTNLTISGTGAFQLNGHIIAGGATPGRTPGASLGAGGTVTNSGSDTAGIVNINTGGGGGNGCMVTINFVNRFNVAPFVSLTPASADAALIPYYILRTTDSFQICSASNAFSKNLSFTYIVID